MYLVVVSNKEGGCDYFGPFKTAERAEEYAKSCMELSDYGGHVVRPLVVPHNSGVRVV